MVLHNQQSWHIYMRKPGQLLPSILAENIKAYRRVKGISQEELADRCGLHRTYVGSVERCERNVSLSTLEIFAAALNVSVPHLLTRHHHKNDPWVAEKLPCWNIQQPPYDLYPDPGRRSKLVDSFSCIGRPAQCWASRNISARVSFTYSFKARQSKNMYDFGISYS